MVYEGPLHNAGGGRSGSDLRLHRTTNPRAALRVKSRIKMDAEMLGDFPFMARSTGKAGVRVLTVTPYPYLIFYTVRDDEVLILHIRHGARRPWQPSD